MGNYVRCHIISAGINQHQPNVQVNNTISSKVWTKDVFICPVEYALKDKDICEKMWCKLNIFHDIYFQMLLCLLFRMWLSIRKWIRRGDKKKRKWIQRTFCSLNQWDWDQYYHAVVNRIFSRSYIKSSWKCPVSMV